MGSCWVVEAVGSEFCRANRDGRPPWPLPCLASSYGPLGEAEHVRALGVLGEASALLEWQCAIWVYLAFESLEERFARWSCSCAPVMRAAPRDLCCDAMVDVLGYGDHLPSATAGACLVSRLVSAPEFARLRADARAGGETRRSVRRSLMATAPRWCARASGPGSPGRRGPAGRVPVGGGKGSRAPFR
jgi:hypothetical protein